MEKRQNKHGQRDMWERARGAFKIYAVDVRTRDSSVSSECCVVVGEGN